MLWAQLSVNNFTCSNNLTLSMGATAVLEMAAAIPPAKKSFKKLTTASDMVGAVLCRYRDPWLRSSGKPNAPQSGRGHPICPNIWVPFIARILHDGFAFWQTDKRGWINIRGWSSRRAPCFWNQEKAKPGTFKGHNMCHLIIIKTYIYLLSNLILIIVKYFTQILLVNSLLIHYPNIHLEVNWVSRSLIMEKKSFM